MIVYSTRREEVEKKLILNISRKKTVYKRFNVHRNVDGNSDINLHGDNLEKSDGDGGAVEEKERTSEAEVVG